MRYILTILFVLLLSSCSNDNPYSTLVSIDNPVPQKYKWESIELSHLGFTQYHNNQDMTGEILSAESLLELQPAPNIKLDVKTMKLVEEPAYRLSYGCVAYCPRYRMQVRYEGNFIATEYVVEIQYYDNTPNELIDESDFYINK